ncbi:chromate transporter, partial [Acinetobacter baumannii]
LVTATGWLDDGEFLELLEVSQTLPGLNATNMAVLVGDKLRGVPGAIAGLVGMMLPGSLFIAMLGAAYATYGGTQLVTAVLGGVAAAAVGVM